LIEKIIIK